MLVTSMPIGHAFEHALQWRHSFSNISLLVKETCKKLILLKGAKIAPTGQKYLHQPRSTVKINTRNRMNITSAIQKKGLGTNLLGYKIRVGIVPVRMPTGQISVNIKPMRAVVRMTSPMSVAYFTYRKYGSILCLPIFFISGYFFNLLAIFPVPLCSKPMGHAHPHIPLPDVTPKKPRIKIGKRSNFHLKLPLYTLCSIARKGQADVAAGQELQ